VPIDPSQKRGPRPRLQHLYHGPLVRGHGIRIHSHCSLYDGVRPSTLLRCTRFWAKASRMMPRNRRTGSSASASTRWRFTATLMNSSPSYVAASRTASTDSLSKTATMTSLSSCCINLTVVSKSKHISKPAEYENHTEFSELLGAP
jgi:hypothetical protein